MDELQPGVVVSLAPGIRRLIAPNAGPLTGPGTNSYLLGEDTIAVLDPGPAEPAHLARLAKACNGRARWILVTHTHRDHSPGAAPLAEALGAELVGMPAPAQGPQDTSFRPVRVPADGDGLQIDAFSLTAVHTPGHASNHLCWLLQPGGWLFTGDHIMAGSTVVIAPPDGNMNQYLASLERLRSLPVQLIAPGHGQLLDRPFEVVDWIIAHRLQREARVVGALARRTAASADELLADVYADTATSLHPLARLSLQAHLEKLLEDGRASTAPDGRFTLVS